MTDSDQIWFEQFRLDIQGQLLWHGHERLALSPKAFALLCYLVEHQGQLVTKASLLETIWPDTVVGDGVLAVGIAELRKALGDDPHAPRFIETVHRRGYRFIGKVVSSQHSIVSRRILSTNLNYELRTKKNVGFLFLKPTSFIFCKIN